MIPAAKPIIGDDERAALGIGASAEGMARDLLVVAGARGFEVGEVGRVVDVPEPIGVDVADLDPMAVGEVALDGPRARRPDHQSMLPSADGRASGAVP